LDRQLVADGTEWGSEEWYAARWNSVPDEMKKKIVVHLRKALDELDDVNREDPYFHFGAGMGIRNYLREVVKDDELPMAPYPNGKEFQNWDDYYQQAIRAALNDN
jgi:hypothetical protein